MNDGLKHIIINGQPYLVEPVVYEWHLALSEENERLREQVQKLKLVIADIPSGNEN